MKLEMSASKWNWGVPDWRDADAYPAPDASTNEWRWEFLRRRSDYREDWVHYYEESFRRNMDIWQSIPTPEGIASWAEHYSRSANMPNKFDEETGHGIPEHIEKYGVSYLKDPAAEYQLGLFQLPKRAYFLRLEHAHGSERWPYTKILKIRDALERAGLDVTDVDELIGSALQRANSEIREQAGMYSYEFDLSEPLVPQIKHAKIHLSAIHKELFGRPRKQPEHRAKWPLYLRVLDARDAGETFQTIGVSLMGLDADTYSDDVPVDEYDRDADRIAASKSWAKKRHDQALQVAFKGFR